MTLAVFETLPDDADSEVINVRITRVRKEKRDLQLLLDSPGWLIVQELAAINATNMKLELGIKPFDGMADVFQDQWVKGRADGMQQIIRGTLALIDHYQRELVVLNAKMKEREHVSHSDDTPEPGRASSESVPQRELFVPESDEHAP